MRIGRTQRLRIERESPHGFYLADEEAEVLLPRGRCPAQARLGDSILVFVYTDSEDRPVATTKHPLAEVGDFALLRVVSITPAGAFFDWGLDKDLFCAVREHRKQLHVGEQKVVAVYLDEVSNRVACSPRVGRFLNHSGTELEIGQKVEILVYGTGENWIDAIVDGRIKGSLFPDEFIELLKPGDVRDAYVKSIREHDGLVALSLRPQGHRALFRERDRVLETVREAGGRLLVSDKSSPEEIQRLFGLSKGAFKKLIGNLYRDGLIKIDQNAISLVE